jgi:hypothetical protein
VLIAVSTSQLSSVILSDGNVVYAYSNNFDQAASLVNNCSGDHESSQICVNTNPQTQGKENVVDTQVITPPGPPGPQGPQGTLRRGIFAFVQRSCKNGRICTKIWGFPCYIYRTICMA